MNSVKIWLNSIFLAIVLTGCTTVVPGLATNNGPSWDNGERNSGTYNFVTNSTGVYVAISPHARDRYNDLIEKYHKKLPLLHKDYGITDNGTNFYLTLEGAANFGKMNRWDKQPVPR